MWGKRLNMKIINKMNNIVNGCFYFTNAYLLGLFNDLLLVLRLLCFIPILKRNIGKDKHDRIIKMKKSVIKSLLEYHKFKNVMGSPIHELITKSSVAIVIYYIALKLAIYFEIIYMFDKVMIMSIVFIVSIVTVVFIYYSFYLRVCAMWILFEFSFPYKSANEMSSSFIMEAFSLMYYINEEAFDEIEERININCNYAHKQISALEHNHVKFDWDMAINQLANNMKSNGIIKKSV